MPRVEDRTIIQQPVNMAGSNPPVHPPVAPGPPGPVTQAGAPAGPVAHVNEPIRQQAPLNAATGPTTNAPAGTAAPAAADADKKKDRTLKAQFDHILEKLHLKKSHDKPAAGTTTTSAAH